jgi:hypothetical protein
VMIDGSTSNLQLEAPFELCRSPLQCRFLPVSDR